jgi:hypothetical protein
MVDLQDLWKVEGQVVRRVYQINETTKFIFWHGVVHLLASGNKAKGE